MNILSARSEWIFQRVTGVLLIVIFAVHVLREWMSSGEAEGIQGPVVGDQFFEIGISFSPLFYQVIAIGTLAILLYHGLNGVHNITVGHTRELNDRQITLIGALLAVAGIVLFVQGVLIINMIAGMQTGGV